MYTVINVLDQQCMWFSNDLYHLGMWSHTGVSLGRSLCTNALEKSMLQVTHPVIMESTRDRLTVDHGDWTIVVLS